MEEKQKTIIFYFTGTGNSLYITKELAKNLEDLDMVAIPHAIDRESFVYRGYSRVGFVIPLYFMGMPAMVNNFINKVQIPNANYVFSIVTRAYTKGLVFTEMNKNLIKKGKKLNYGRYISFPDCYIRWAQAIDSESQAKVFSKATEKLAIIKQELLKEKIFVEREGKLLNTASMVINKIWKAKLSSINKTFKVNSGCTKCGICIKTCPAKNIKFENNILKWGNKCEDCMACVQGCPNKAIYFSLKTPSKRRYRNPNILRNELFYW